MRKLTLVVIAAFAASALAVPAAAPAKAGKDHKAAKQCTLGQSASGKHAAKQLRRCEKRLRQAQMRQAKRECRAERRADPVAFAELYGNPAETKPGKRRGHVFKRCVREKLSSDAAPTGAALKNAAKECRAMQAEDPEGFAEEYGDRPNAFAKCVVAHVRDDGDDDGDDETVVEPGEEETVVEPDPDDTV